jgi:hypothetical protein
MSVLSNHILSLYGVYSTFLLNKGYQGALLQVRRTEDNVLAEVYPDSTGKISLNSYVRVTKLESQARNLGNFACAPGFQRDISIGINVSVELRVSKVYNQSLIQNNDLQMTTAGSQPIIFISNTLKSNTLGPSIYFDNHSLTISKLPTNFTYHTCIKPLTSKNYTSTYFTNSTNTIKAFSEYSTTTNIFKARVAGLLNRGVGIDNFYSFNKQQTDDKAYGDVQINQLTAQIPERFLTFECESDPALYNTNPYTISPYGDVNFIVIYDDQLTPIKRSNRIRRQETSQLLAQYNEGIFTKLNRINPQSVLNKYPTPKYAFACKSLTGKVGGTRQPLVEVIRGANTTNRVIVHADNKGEISLDSVVTLSNGVSLATTLGEFAGAPGYANPDSISESNVFTYRLINQVDKLEANDYSPTVVSGHQNYPVLYNTATKLQKINNYAALFNSTTVAAVSYQFAVNNGGGQSVIGVYLNRDNIGTLMGDSQFGGTKSLALTYGTTGPYYFSNLTSPYTVPNITTNPHPTPAPNVPTITSFFRSDTSSYRVKTNGKLHKVSTGLALADLIEQNFIGPIQGAVAAVIGYDCDITSFEEDITKELKTLFITTPAPAKGLLDTYPNAAAAYSVRRLKSDAPAAMRVRRASDNTELNIEFNNDGSLNTTQLTTFCTGTNCFVKVWFDQSGNVRHAEQTTTANQPKIYDSSTGLVTQGGFGAPTFDGTNDLFTFNASSLNANLISAFVVTRTAATTGYGTALAIAGNVATDRFHLGYKNNDNNFYFLYDENLTSAQAANTNVNLFSMLASSGIGGAVGYINGVSKYTYNTLVSQAMSASATIGAFGLATGTLNGSVQEVIIYASDQSSNRTGIEQNINANYGIYWDGTQTGLLDTYPSAAAAYSVRALNSAYTGPILRVRRASDNTEQDIYALYNGELNVQALTAFCAGTNGFVRTWYDQSGNARNATQTTTANQPKIYDSSTGVIILNGKPALDYDSTDVNAVPSSTATFKFLHDGTNSAVIWAGQIGKVANPAALYVFLSNFNGSSANVGFEIFYDDRAASSQSDALRVQIAAGGSFAVQMAEQNAITPNAQAMIFANFDADNATAANRLKMAVNGGSLFGSNTLTNAPSGNNSLTDLRIGAGGAGFVGYKQEVVIYPSDQSANRAGIETNINDYYSIY